MGGGLSYITYFLTITWREEQRSASEKLVLRVMPEIGHVPPYDIRPQYEVLTRLQGTGVPVPQVYWLEMDNSVLGRPFFVMKFVEGEGMVDAYAREPGLRPQLHKEYIDNLVKIHTLDWQALGLSVLGVPEHKRQYAERDLERWTSLIKKYQYSPQPVLAEALVWLRKNMPQAERFTLCHGDYYAHNVFCRGGHIVALFDWELTGIGDPINDVAWTTVFMSILPGFWNEKEFIKAYEEASGTKVKEESFVFWKLLGYYRFAAMGLAGFKVGLDSEESGIQPMAAWSHIMPLILDGAARTLKF
jgi:aminoglycoside phosphotransferase (APT) family kinase protein